MNLLNMEDCKYVNIILFSNFLKIKEIFKSVIVLFYFFKSVIFVCCYFFKGGCVCWCVFYFFVEV